MAGHSHWAQVKHKKAIVDAKKGQIFSKLLRAITIAAKEGSNPETNYKLRSAIERAKSLQVPLENIERAIRKAESKEEIVEEVVFEAYLDEIQILIKGITDNKNRTLGEVRSVLNKYNAKLAEPGSVRWNFREKVKILLNKINKKDEEKVLELVDLFDDIKEINGDILLITDYEKFGKLKDNLEKFNIEIKEYSFELEPINTIENLDNNLQNKLKELIDELLDLDDIEEVYTNTV